MRTLLSAAVTTALAVVFFTGSAAAADEWGTVKGQVTWAGKEIPKPAKLDTSKEPKCDKCNVHDEKFVISKDGGLKNVIVWLQDANQNPRKAMIPLKIHPSLKESKTKEVIMDQPCCKFEPRIIALRDDQTLIGKNSSEILHNMHWFSSDEKNPGDNKAIAAGGKLEIKLEASLKSVQIQCDVHGWMKGAVRVFNHPYFAVTDADGRFEIKNAPAGKYHIMMWHEGGFVTDGGGNGEDIEIPAGKAIEFNKKWTPSEQ
jgi:hypothetical protein